MTDEEHNANPDRNAPDGEPEAGMSMSRRDLFRTTLAVAASVTLTGAHALEPQQATAATPASPEPVEAGESASNRVPVRVTVNDVEYSLNLAADVTLLDLLREQLQLSGTHKGCNRGECGACTVMLDGRRVNGCLVFAATLDGRRVQTIEGLARGGQLHPVQQAFIQHDSFQCGFCTSGQIMSAVGCIAEGHTGSNDEIREWMSGNLCRCSAYPQIAAAVEAAAKQMQGERHATV
jgi:xanthine dehydrogenase YagT iron-sulfur-binding subunit